MKIITTFLIFLYLINFEITLSQEISTNNCFNSAGIKASNISGYGIYYNRKLSDNLNIQFNGLIYYYQNKSNNIEQKIFNYDIGFEIQRNVFIGNNYRYYLLAGAFYYRDDDKKDGNDNLIQIINHSFNIGIGFVGEYQYNRLIFSFDIGYKYFEDNLETTINNNLSFPELKRVTKIGAGIGAGFIF